MQRNDSYRIFKELKKCCRFELIIFKNVRKKRDAQSAMKSR